jgi:hypothetical protein
MQARSAGIREEIAMPRIPLRFIRAAMTAAGG